MYITAKSKENISVKGMGNWEYWTIDNICTQSIKNSLLFVGLKRVEYFY